MELFSVKVAAVVWTIFVQSVCTAVTLYHVTL